MLCKSFRNFWIATLYVLLKEIQQYETTLKICYTYRAPLHTKPWAFVQPGKFRTSSSRMCVSEQLLNFRDKFPLTSLSNGRGLRQVIKVQTVSIISASQWHLSQWDSCVTCPERSVMWQNNL